jgi:hypothetical protein
MPNLNLILLNNATEVLYGKVFAESLIKISGYEAEFLHVTLRELCETVAENSLV